MKSSGQDEKGQNLMKALAERTQHVVHLTHNDLDAAGCDAIHRMKYGDVFTIWASVGKFPAMLDAVGGSAGRGDTISISDLGYHKGVMERIAKARSNGWKIEWRDHHRWRNDEIEAVRKKIELLHVDTSTCATGIVARELLPGDATAAEVARVVCDYDLWKHEDPRSKVLGQVVMRRKNRDHVRDCLIKGVFTDELIEREYAGIMREMDRDITKSVGNTKIVNNRYRIAFAPLYGYPSETAHTIRDRLKTDIEVIVSANGRFSIRSVPPISHLIAREFEGGGHPNAAGGSFEFSFLDKLAFWLLKRNRHYGRLADVAAAIAE